MKVRVPTVLAIGNFLRTDEALEVDAKALLDAAKMLGMSKSACCRMQQRVRRYLTAQMRAE